MRKLSKEELRNIFMEEISPDDDLFEVFCKGYELGKEKKDKYSYDVVSKYFVYDETSPSCVRTVKGGAVGSVSSTGYYKVRATPVGSFTAHRVVMTLHGYNIHDKLVDHIDGNCLNNKIDNLRVVNSIQNARNRKLSDKNWYGIQGITYEHNTGFDYFKAQGNVGSRCIRRYFNIKKMGIMEAFAAAVKYREDLLQEAQKDGNLYTDRHKGFSGEV